MNATIAKDDHKINSVVVPVVLEDESNADFITFSESI